MLKFFLNFDRNVTRMIMLMLTFYDVRKIASSLRFVDKQQIIFFIKSVKVKGFD